MANFDQAVTLRCSRCRGSGADGADPCPLCGGAGVRTQTVPIRNGDPVGHSPGSPSERSYEGEAVDE